MAIIYSYPTVTPELDDLLIGSDKGDDNATKSFTVSSLVSLIIGQSGTGTVTSVTVDGDTWISSTGSPITSTGTINIGLSASGTPSATTFLRGDNSFVAPSFGKILQVVSATKTVAKLLRPKEFVIYESTVYPGLCRGFCMPILEKISGLNCIQTDKNISNKLGFHLGYSPERINPGDKEHTLEKIIKVTSGLSLIHI